MNEAADAPEFTSPKELDNKPDATAFADETMFTGEESMWRRKPPPLPVPSTLREMLKDYPELIEQIQERLNQLLVRLSETRPHISNPAYEQAVWAFEDMMGGLWSDAKDDLEVAEQGGDPVVIDKAKAKEFLVDRARLSRPWFDDDFYGYFESHKGAFQ